jgi:hypothetical protein
MSSDTTSDEDLRRGAERAAHLNGSLTAGLVRVWDRVFPEEPLAASLSCSARTVQELALCLRPRPESWLSDVREIASATGIDGVKLEGFFRSAEVLERMAMAHPVDQHVGQLMAARDRDEED